MGQCITTPRRNQFIDSSPHILNKQNLKKGSQGIDNTHKQTYEIQNMQRTNDKIQSKIMIEFEEQEETRNMSIATNFDQKKNFLGNQQITVEHNNENDDKEWLRSTVNFAKNQQFTHELTKSKLKFTQLSQKSPQIDNFEQPQFDWNYCEVLKKKNKIAGLSVISQAKSKYEDTVCLSSTFQSRIKTENLPQTPN